MDEAAAVVVAVAKAGKERTVALSVGVYATAGAVKVEAVKVLEALDLGEEVERAEGRAAKVRAARVAAVLAARVEGKPEDEEAALAMGCSEVEAVRAAARVQATQEAGVVELVMEAQAREKVGARAWARRAVMMELEELEEAAVEKMVEVVGTEVPWVVCL